MYFQKYAAVGNACLYFKPVANDTSIRHQPLKFFLVIGAYLLRVKVKLVLKFYNDGVEALDKGADVNGLIKMEVRERIGRFKYTLNDDIQKEYEAISKELATEIANLLGKEDF